ncbi:hypothetical protein [Novosphingobium sp. TCA1]|uniref:hypothetical protein n=1 Tax=Novosphingobium sp. TCA1 TaxID=2682474 RepID=UPI001308CD03|nr:hypothetical protein [Novosphingobium sp. TCA1]GFE77864.1 hypothetical protein NTCA1_55130 [Novosphingobium sp. TCA1]
MDDFYAARSGTIPPLAWPNIAPPFSGDLSKLETVCIDAIARHNLDTLSHQLFARDADQTPDD